MKNLHDIKPIKKEHDWVFDKTVMKSLNALIISTATTQATLTRYKLLFNALDFNLNTIEINETPNS